MKQMLKSPSLHPARCQLGCEYQESADAMTAAVEATGSPVSDFNKGNIKARCRMIAQYALAGSHSGAVIEQTTPQKISQVSLPSLVTAVRIFSSLPPQ